jgi:Pilus assembly protein, PilO
MLNFKDKEESGPAGLMLLAILILFGSLLYMLIVPKPTVAGMTKGKERSRQQILVETEKIRARGKEAAQANLPRLWEGDPDRIAALVLATLTQSAAQHQIKINAFRPQRVQQQGEMNALPFTLQAIGTAKNVRDFVATLDGPSSKLALQNLQLASTDASSSTVNASLSFTAYAMINRVTK